MIIKFFSNKSIITLVVALALFMDSLDATILNTAIPVMARSFNVNPVDLKIALISYLLSLAIFIPISGLLADKFGIKPIFILALCIFTVSSLFCGYSNNLIQLMIARSVQGLGGAFMLPLGRLIILRTFAKHEIVEAMNAVIMVVSLGLMLGPLAGGIITDHLSWHWIFWINIPVGLLVIVISIYWLKAYPPKKTRPLDKFGFILFGGGLSMFTFSFSQLSESTANQHKTMLFMLIAVLMLIGYFIHSKRQQYPLINMKLFHFRTFRVSIMGNLFARLSFGAVPFLLPLLLQVGLGFRPQLSGMLLAPIAVGVLAVKSISLLILRALGYKRLLLINTFLIGLSIWSFGMINAQISLSTIAILTFIFGVFISLHYGGMNSLAYAQIPTNDLSDATSLVSTIQQLGQTFGVAAGAILLQLFSFNPSNYSVLSLAVFHETFFAMGFLTFFSGLVFLQLKINDGHQMLKKMQVIT